MNIKFSEVMFLFITVDGIVEKDTVLYERVLGAITYGKLSENEKRILRNLVDQPLLKEILE